MASPPYDRPEQKKIALGIVFMTVGTVVLLTVALIWFLAPMTVSQHLRVSAPSKLLATNGNALQPAPTLVPTAVPVDVPLKSPASPSMEGHASASSLTAIDAEVPVLLPETPQQPSDFLGSTSTTGEFPVQAGASLNQPARLVIPALGVDASIQRVGLVSREENGQKYMQWSVPRGYAAGWHDSSALLGRPGNTVLNGHNNIHGAIFRDLVELSLGEQIVLYDAERAYVYQITERHLLEERGQPLSIRYHNARFLLPTSDERITIISCWPDASNSHRVVVIATPAEAGG